LKRAWFVLRLVVFVPIALLIGAGFLLAGLMNYSVFRREGRDTAWRWIRAWERWLNGEISTYDLIK